MSSIFIHLEIQSSCWIPRKLLMNYSTNEEIFTRPNRYEPWFMNCKWHFIPAITSSPLFVGWDGTGYYHWCRTVQDGDVTERSFRSISTSTTLQSITLFRCRRRICCCGTYWLVPTTLIYISEGLLANFFCESNSDGIYRAAAAIILKVTYGYDVTDEHDSYIVLSNAALQTFSQASVFGAFLVDYIPMLKYVPSWMPGASFKRKACEWRHLSHQMVESQFKIVKQNMVSWATTWIIRLSRNTFRLKALRCHVSQQENWRVG